MILPTVRIELEIERIRQHAVSAIYDHLDEIKGHVESEMKRAISGYNFAAEVKIAVNLAIDNAVKDEVRSFFGHGKGNDAIRAAVRQGLAATMADEDSKKI